MSVLSRLPAFGALQAFSRAPSALITSKPYPHNVSVTHWSRSEWWKAGYVARGAVLARVRLGGCRRVAGHQVWITSSLGHGHVCVASMTYVGLREPPDLRGGDAGKWWW